MSDLNLELQLQELAAAVDFPPTPDLRNAVRLRLDRPRWSHRRLLALALAVLVVALAGVLAVPSARTAVLEWLGIEGVRFQFVDRLPVRPVRRTPDLGQTMALPDIRARASFPVVVPPGDLGDPQVYFREPPRGGLVSFVYGSKTRARLILSEFRGDYRPFLQKTISQTAVVTETTVDGVPAIWLVGAHDVEYADAAGQFSGEPARLAGRVLLWRRGVVTYRLEGDLSLDQALEIARSVR